MPKNIITIFSFFILFLVPFKVWPQQTSKFAEGANTIIDVISGLANNYLQSSQQQSQDYMNILRQQQMMKQMTPQVAPPSPLSIFPNCPIPGEGQSPAGMCSNIQGPDGFMMAQNVKAMAIQFDAFYEPYLSASATGVGNSCIELSIKKLAQDLSAKSNQFQSLMDQIKKGQQQFAEEANAIKKNMQKIYNELNGGGSDLEEKTKDYTAMFPGCRGIIPSDALTNPKGGLIGIRSSLDNTGMRGAAQNVLTNQAVYAKEIEELVERIKDDVNGVGIDTFFEGGATQSKWFKGGITQFGGVEQILIEKRKEMDLKRARIAEDLAAVGYKAPRMDQNFNKKFGEFASGASVYFQKKYINDCVVGGNEQIKRLGLNSTDLMKSVQHISFRRQGAAVSTYRSRLETIVNGPGFIDEKIEQIRALDKIYGKNSFVILYKNSAGNYSKEPVANYFISMMSTCEKAYQAGGALSKDTPGGSTYKEKVENAQKSINELRQLEAGFTGSIGTLLKDKLLNCSNAPLKEGSCSPDVMSATNPEFCMKRATFCAERTRACFTHADNLIKDRTRKMKINADLYNKKIEALVINQEKYLQTMMAQVNNDVNALKQMFPGATFKVPADLVIAMPAPVDTELGVQLRGGGNMGFLLGLPEQLNKMKKALEDQGKLAIMEAKDYQNKTIQKIQDARKKWQAIAAECDDAMGEFNKNYSEYMKKVSEEQAELGNEVSEFCFKYERLGNSNPMAGCDGDNSPSKLYDDAIKVASFLNPDVLTNLGKYEKLCAASQNTSQIGSEEDKRPELIKLCDLAGNDWKNVLNFKREELLRKISDKNLRSKALSYLNSTENIDINPQGMPPTLLRQIVNLKQLQEQKGDSRDSLIKELNGDVKTKEELKFEEIKKSVSEMKKEMGHHSFKDFKKELDKIDKNLTLKDIKTAREDLDSLLKSNEKFEQAVGPENLDNLKAQMEELKKFSEEISPKGLSELAEVPPSGLGTDHQDLFKKGNDEENLCNALKNQQVASAISKCSENSTFDKCFKRQLDLNSDEIEPGLFDILNRKLKSITSFENPEMIADRWSALGEEGQGACTAQSAESRKSKEPEKKGIDKILDDVQKALGKEI